jgi:hypothetical protein
MFSSKASPLSSEKPPGGRAKNAGFLTSHSIGVTLASLLGLLGALFWRSFLPGTVVFSNDGPLGANSVDYAQGMTAFTAMWGDLNSIGGNAGSAVPNLTCLLGLLAKPVLFGKFFAPYTLLIAGLGAWTFFRALKLSPLAALLGTFAAVLNSTFFTSACWGVGPQETALGMNFFALALVVSNTAETARGIRWIRLALAGLCVGMGVVEAFDIGALYSLFVAAFVFFKAIADGEKSTFHNVFKGIARVGIIAVFAGFIGFQTISGLVSTQIQGVAGTAQDSETKAQHWDWATQWSLPKKETLGLFAPGVFGYKMDTPKDMMPALRDAYRGGEYWGGMGRDPALDRYFDAGGEGAPPPSGFMRFSGGGNYCGILVLLIAAWGLAQSFRRQNSPFSDAQKKLIWFWGVVAAVCLPLAWGRFAPGSHTSDGVLFYALLYKLPYFSTIRNPAKFLFFFSWAVVILFAYGIHALNRRYLDAAAPKSAGVTAQLKTWWARAGAFDRKWTWFCGALFGASILGWLIYAAQKPALVKYLQKVGFPDETTSGEIAAFSIGQAGWFLALLAVALALLTMTIAGCFNGSRAKIGACLLGGFLLFDLGRADLPYVIHWDYKQKYEVGTLNPIVDFLRNKPYEHRVAGLPFRAPQGLELFDELYRIEWMQHHFLYYNVQCLDIIQMSRMPTDLKSYLEAFQPQSNETATLFARHWQLTNTRYLLGAAGFLDILNQQLDPAQKRFRIVQRFEVAPKPGIVQPTRLEELTAAPNDNGPYALFEFTGALPRAKLYSNWQINTNDAAVLKTLADLNFDPAQTVLVDAPGKNLPATATNENAGTVEFKSYAPKKIVFTAHAAAPSVLLLNDRFDPDWRVTVDGRPAELLRCNYLMRGVAVPPGAHEVEFDFSVPHKSLYVTLSALGLGILLGGILLVTREQPDPSE